MKLGIVGLPNVGKSTLFNAVTKAGAQSANYPFCTIDPNIGVVSVPDERLQVLEKMHQSKSVVPTAINFYDIAGLVKGASKGEGLGNKFLSHIREVAAILHVVRCFEDSDVTHVDGSVDPERDVETIGLELIFSDIETIEKKMERSKKQVKTDKALQEDIKVLEMVKENLENGKSVREMELTEKEELVIRELNLLSSKPVIYVANVSEEYIADDTLSNDYLEALQKIADAEGSAMIKVCAKIEEEISELEDDEKAMFLEDLGLSTSGLDKLIHTSYDLLGLITYLTAGPQEVRAWTIKKGTKAPKAAGKIHTDFERGFIRAEVTAYEDLIAAGNPVAAKEKGLVRLEGKDYVVKDGDVILFRFNV